MVQLSPGARFRAVLPKQGEEGFAPLPIVGTVNAYTALLAARAGHRALYLSGAGVANASLGLPDLAITHLGDVAEDVRRITYVTDLPLLVDIDTGWGSAFSIQRSIKELERSGAAAIHIEDQAGTKRCGHRPNKQLTTCEDMCDRVKASVDARQDQDFFVMARTDAYAQEGRESALSRAQAYIEAGADGIFVEALTTLDDYAFFASNLQAPILANITEFGKTPLLTRDELGQAGVSMALYPLSAFRAMSRAAEQVYETLMNEPCQKTVLDKMQTREELYEVLGYHQYEAHLDSLNKK